MDVQIDFTRANTLDAIRVLSVVYETSPFHSLTFLLQNLLEKDDGFCKRCGSAEQPEWILLCDKCDAGYHASCLKPMLFLVPTGDWFCPPCNHVSPPTPTASATSPRIPSRCITYITIDDERNFWIWVTNISCSVMSELGIEPEVFLELNFITTLVTILPRTNQEYLEYVISFPFCWLDLKH